MCYDCQQCVEKALKALLVFEKIEFEWTHNIGILIKNLEEFIEARNLAEMVFKWVKARL